MRFSLRALFVFTTIVCILAAISNAYYHLGGVDSLSFFAVLLTIFSPFICLAFYPFASSYDYSHEARTISAVLLVISTAVLIGPLVDLPGLVCVGLFFCLLLSIVLVGIIVDERRSEQDR